jgi:FlgD Ig-like domain
MRPFILAAAIAAAMLAAIPDIGLAAFQNGDLYLLSPALPGPNTTTIKGIVRVNPSTGTSTLLYSTGIGLGSYVDYDAYRDLLVFTRSDSLLGINSSGAVTLLNHLPSLQVGAIAARGDGPVYIQIAAELRYIDAGNVLHGVLDQPGTATFSPPGGPLSIRELHYDRPSQSLIACFEGGTIGLCPDANQICATKIPLNVAGTQVSGALTSAQHDVSTSSEVVVDLSSLPGNRVLIVVQTNNGAQEPRMLALDPATMTIANYAANGPYTGASTTSAGTYSSVRGEVVILDSFNDSLHSFPEGGSGFGAVFSDNTTGFGVSGTGIDEACGMVEIARVPTSVRTAALPANLMLEPVYPNPLSAGSTMRYHLEHGASVKLAVYDVNGRRVRTLFEGARSAGWYAATWDGITETGNRVASGVYFVRLTSSSETSVRRFVVLH